jgi:hypothetical protein
LVLLIPSISLLGLFWMLSQASPFQLYWGLGALIPGIPIYFLQKKKNNSMIEVTS